MGHLEESMQEFAHLIKRPQGYGKECNYQEGALDADTDGCTTRPHMEDKFS